MSYSDQNPAWDRMHRSRYEERTREIDARVQWELRRAATLLRRNRRMTRDEALRRAAHEYDETGGVRAIGDF